MYAIITDGRQQLKVEEGQELAVDFRELHKGDKLTFGEVLAVSDGQGNTTIGTPTLSGASVEAEVLGVEQGPKLYIRKFRRRKNSRTRTGHRQLYTKVRISKIAT